jgi:hypothetical protein
MKRKKCTNPKLQGKISLEIGFNLAASREIHFTPEQSQHLAQCDECNCLLPAWFRKGDYAREQSTAFDIVNLAESGDPRVLKKAARSGTVLFKPSEEDPSRGVLVKIDSETGIGLPQDALLEEFERLQ